jgi:hypothetical protein
MEVEPLEMHTSYDPFILETEPTPVIDIPIYGEDRSTTNKTSDTLLCQACNKSFTNKYSLERHFERSPVCTQWCNLDESIKTENAVFNRTINTSIIDFVDEIKTKVTTVLTTIHKKEYLICKYCKVGFSNVGNLNKHFKTAITCNRFAYVALYEELKNMGINASCRDRTYDLTVNSRSL